MNPHDLLSDAPFPPGDRREQLLQARLLLNYLADHVYHAELRDATDFRQWLLDLAEEARNLGQLAENTKVSWMTVKGPCRKVTTPPPQPRYDPTCPRCGHVHEGSAECGMDMGNGRFCRCEMEVVA
jgi:hypothetical protein